MARPKDGYRNAAGREVPGTTTIIGRFKDSGPLMFWAFKQGKSGARTLYEKRDEAADVGTVVHELVENDIQGIERDPSSADALTTEQQAQACAAFDSYLEWKQAARMTIVATEEPMVSEALQCGGTVDAVAYVNDKLCLVDWKTSKDFYTDQLIQLTFYMDLWEENHPGPENRIHGVHIIRFGKSGTEFSHHFFRRDHPKVEIARGLFALYRDAYELDKQLGK